MSEREPIAADGCGRQLPFLLAAHGVDTVFGIPGVHSLELYRTLEAAGIRHVGVRHEQGAGFMADGYARASGRPGVCLLITGPGVTNAATPIGQAYSDSVPVLVMSAGIARSDEGLGRGSLHEITDQRAVTRPLTAASDVIWTPEHAAPLLARAFARFAAARPRPVHVSAPIDVLELPAAATPWPAPAPSRPGADPAAVARAAALLSGARRPLVLVGGGAVDASEAVTTLAEALGAPVASSIAGKGVVSDSHPLSLGATLGRAATRRALAEADVVLAIGTELSENDCYPAADALADPALATPRLAITARLVRVDIDPDACVRDQRAEVSLVADARLAADALRAALAPAGRGAEGAARAAAIRQANLEGRGPLERLHAAVLDGLRAALPADGVVAADMTQIAYSGCSVFPCDAPRGWLFPAGFGTLGYALPAAIGAKIACPDRAVVALVGDGGFQYTLTELATAVQLGLSLPILLWDNDALQEIADGMRSRQIPQIDVFPKNPDFVALGRAYGAAVIAPQRLDEIEGAVRDALGRPGPTLIHVREVVMQAAFDAA